MKSTISPIVSAVVSQSSSAVDEVEKAIKRARKVNGYNATLSLIEDRALERAKVIDQKIKDGQTVGRLAGVPFIAKDNFLTLASTTTAASKILGNFKAPLQATAIEKLEAEGAICIGKANLDAFAHGGSTENSAYGVTKNAIDKERVAGGSSGGSAVAVALDIVPFALGTDTGGSIRQPASFNGVVGYKPTYGTVSRFGVVAMASSTDVIGPLTKTVEDAELIVDILAGKDDRDMTTLPDFYAPTLSDSSQKKIGIIKESVGEGVDHSIVDSIYEFKVKLETAGHIVEEVSLPTMPYSLAMYYIIVPAEISSNLARYDGVRYGVRADSKTLEELYGLSRDYGFEKENKRRILIGSYVLSSGYYDAYYNKAQKARTLLIDEYNEAFKNFDFLLTPTAPTAAFKIGENSSDPVKMYAADLLTVAPSLAGLPAISLPADTIEGLPIGHQLIAAQRHDAELLSFSRNVMEMLHG